MSDHRRDLEELETIRADLNDLGEDAGDTLSQELEHARLFSSELGRGVQSLQDAEGPDGMMGLSLLRLESPSASLEQSRSNALFQQLQAKLEEGGIHSTAIAQELALLGESPAQTQELEDGALLGDVLDALRAGPASLESLERHPEALESDYVGLHLLRSISAEAELKSCRSEALLRDVEAKLTAKKSAAVVDLASRRRRKTMGAFFAAAAAVLLVCASGLFIENMSDIHPEPPIMQTSSEVVQVELLHAKDNLTKIEQDALKALMSEASSRQKGHRGDHQLRELRFARHAFIRARVQARERRL